MQHAPETGAKIDSVFLAPVSGTCVMHIWHGFVWYQIPAPNRTLFYSKPGSDVHVTEMMTYDWLMITAYVLM